MKTIILVTLLALITTIYGDCSLYVRPNPYWSDAHLELGYSAGKFISIDKDYAEIGLFNPIDLSCCWVPFIDARGYHFNDGKWAASAGGGIRTSLSNCSVLGINTFYDYRRAHIERDFHQIGVGLEWLNNCWDFRINGYLPISKKTQTKTCVFNELGDGFFAKRQKREFAYSGFTSEIGVPLINNCDFNFYAALGPYYFFRSHQNHFWGGYGRLELNWKSILSLQVRASYDRKHHTRVQGIIQFYIPFDFFCCSSCDDCCNCRDLLLQPVRRNGIILTDNCCNWKWNWDDE